MARRTELSNNLSVCDAHDVALAESFGVPLITTNTLAMLAHAFLADMAAATGERGPRKRHPDLHRFEGQQKQETPGHGE
ncbi:hypothetical protein ACFWP7_22705 [Streptomyces sp. NPDC058470]|uniref:hypothetical protein n=1 Tax=Streptomyces sp. NPDC058470 TaxID=3346515 RepID=UPI003661025A